MENKIKEYEHQLEQNGYEKSSIIQIRAVIGGFFRDNKGKRLTPEAAYAYDLQYARSPRFGSANITRVLTNFMKWLDGKPAPSPSYYNRTGLNRPNTCFRDCTYKSRSNACRYKPLERISPLPKRKKEECTYYRKADVVITRDTRSLMEIYKESREYLCGDAVAYQDSHSARWTWYERDI